MAADPPSPPTVVLDPSGTAAELLVVRDGQQEADVRLASGRRVRVPTATLQLDGDHYRCSVDFNALVEEEAQIIIPLVEEEVRVGKRMRETGRVRIEKRVETQEAVVEESLLREEVVVERVPVGRHLEEPVAVRHEGDTMIIPVIEEVLVVEKRLILKEELHVTKRRGETRATERVTLRQEHVDVERLTPTDTSEDAAEH